MDRVRSLSGLGVALVCGAALAAPEPTPPPQTRRPTATPSSAPTPVAPQRVPDLVGRGAAPQRRITRFPSPHLLLSQLHRIEEVDLDRDGVFEALIEGIGTVRSLPGDAVTLGFLSRRRLPFKNPLLALLHQKTKKFWTPLWIAHLPFRCGQSDDPARCDQVVRFGSIPFRFDDRPQMVVQILHRGEGGHETHAYRLVRGKLENTFSASAPRTALEVSISPEGIARRAAVDTFVNRELPPRYRSFTLNSFFVFGDRRFRVFSESVEEEWGAGRDLDLAYWSLVRDPGFAGDVKRLRERHRRAPAEAPWKLDPLQVVSRRFPDATRVRSGGRQPGVAIVHFERPSCHARAVLYQPVREWEGEKSLWEIATIRASSALAYECLAEERPELGR